MPLHLAGSDPFWIHSARTIFASAALKVDKDNKRTYQALLQPLFSENLAGIGELLAGSPAESLISEKNEKTALSIKATLSTYCKALMYLKDDTKGPLFSIRKQPIRTKYHSDIESMEGAACFYVPKMNHIPCLQLRSISNHVEPRDKSKWNIPLALKHLEDACFNILEYISKQIQIP